MLLQLWERQMARWQSSGQGVLLLPLGRQRMWRTAPRSLLAPAQLLLTDLLASQAP